MSFDYINEAFRKLDALNEEVFDTSLNGLNELSDFHNQDDTTDLVKVIDPDADTEESISDSYVGKVIINCNVCHSHIFESKEDVVIDDEGVVNPEMTCPYCGEMSGFTVVGEIQPFSGEDADAVEDEENTEISDSEETSEESEASEDEDTSLSESYDSANDYKMLKDFLVRKGYSVSSRAALNYLWGVIDLFECGDIVMTPESLEQWLQDTKMNYPEDLEILSDSIYEGVTEDGRYQPTSNAGKLFTVWSMKPGTLGRNAGGKVVYAAGVDSATANKICKQKGGMINEYKPGDEENAEVVGDAVKKVNEAVSSKKNKSSKESVAAAVDHNGRPLGYVLRFVVQDGGKLRTQEYDTTQYLNHKDAMKAADIKNSKVNHNPGSHWKTGWSPVEAHAACAEEPGLLSKLKPSGELDTQDAFYKNTRDHDNSKEVNEGIFDFFRSKKQDTPVESEPAAEIRKPADDTHRKRNRFVVIRGGNDSNHWEYASDLIHRDPASAARERRKLEMSPENGAIPAYKRPVYMDCDVNLAETKVGKLPTKWDSVNESTDKSVENSRNSDTEPKDATNQRAWYKKGAHADTTDSIHESIDDVRGIKSFLQSQLNGKGNGFGGQNSARFATWLAEAPEASWDYGKIAEVAYLMGYDVYETSHGYFDSHDYLIVCSGVDPEIYLADLDDEDKDFWELTKSDLTKLESLNESLEDLSMTANDTHLEISEGENGEVTVTMGPAETSEEIGEMEISPVSDETISEIEANNKEEPEESEESEDEEVDVDIEEVDEEGMDELGESYLKTIYRNVESFKTTNVSSTDSKMIIEGTVTFTSGTKKNTGFVFEAYTANKNGCVRFIGSNKHLTNSRYAFALNGVVKDKKLLPESLTYKYKVNNELINGKVVRK